ncbi:DUF3192 domain-containing protein [Pseudoalteromonas fenneropenaei]|uniref:DUF3192 domain-containing protein n=1 Tax=Pseudoalteromonas fenneropenaei TaxID=1737459 RepID=A0ABV7CLB3_9GAMM
MKKLLLTALLSAPLLTGCVVAVSDGEVDHGWASDYNNNDWRHTQKMNRDKIAKLVLGTDYSSVVNTFSTPDFSESLEKEGAVYQVLYFATHSKHSDGKTTKDECTPLLFKDGKLVGFGETALKALL